MLSGLRGQSRFRGSQLPHKHGLTSDVPRNATNLETGIRSPTSGQRCPQWGRITSSEVATSACSFCASAGRGVVTVGGLLTCYQRLRVRISGGCHLGSTDPPVTSRCDRRNRHCSTAANVDFLQTLCGANSCGGGRARVDSREAAGQTRRRLNVRSVVAVVCRQGSAHE